MRYSDITALEIKCDHSPKYRLCRRGEVNKKSGKFVGVYKNMTITFHEIFSFALINPNKVNDLFSEDGDYMIVECKDGDERVILPEELKKLLIKERDNILTDYHRFDRPDGSMHEACTNILDVIDRNIK